MSNNLIDKVYIGLENAPAAFDIRTRILGPVSFLKITIGVLTIYLSFHLLNKQILKHFRMVPIWNIFVQKLE